MIAAKTAQRLKLINQEIRKHQTRKNHVNRDLVYCVHCEKRYSSKDEIISFKNELKELETSDVVKNDDRLFRLQIRNLIREIESVEHEK